MRASIDIASTVLGHGAHRIIEPGALVWIEGAPATTVALILAGEALLSVYDPRGCTDVPVGLAVASELLGDEVLSDAPARSTTVRAVTRLRLHVVHADEVRDRIHCVPAAGELVSKLLARRTSWAARAAAASRDPLVEGRVLRWLVHLAEQTGHGAPTAVIPLGQAELAQLCATRRPTLNRILRAHADLGLIHVGRGRVVVPDVDALRRAASGDPERAVAS